MLILVELNIWIGIKYLHLIYTLSFIHRAKHSTMTAHANMKKDWTKNTEEGLMTGILIWDLSASFDTLDTELLCNINALFILNIVSLYLF